MDTSPSHHVRSSPQHMDKKFQYEWTHHPVIMPGQTHNTWTRSLTMNGHITQSSCQVKPTTHGQEVSLWMDTSPSHHVRTNPQHMDKNSRYEWTHHTVIMSVQAHCTTHRQVVSLFMDTPSSHHVQAHSIGTSTVWCDVSIQSGTNCPCGVGLNSHGDCVMCLFIVRLHVRMLWAWTYIMCDVSVHSETTCLCVVGLNWHDDYVMCPFIMTLPIRVVCHIVRLLVPPGEKSYWATCIFIFFRLTLTIQISRAGHGWMAFHAQWSGRCSWRGVSRTISIKCSSRQTINSKCIFVTFF